MAMCNTGKCGSHCQTHYLSCAVGDNQAISDLSGGDRKDGYLLPPLISQGFWYLALCLRRAWSSAASARAHRIKGLRLHTVLPSVRAWGKVGSPDRIFLHWTLSGQDQNAFSGWFRILVPCDPAYSKINMGANLLEPANCGWAESADLSMASPVIIGRTSTQFKSATNRNTH